MHTRQENRLSFESVVPYPVRAFVAIARQSFLVMLTNRLRFYTGVVTYLVYVAVYAAIWKAVYSTTGSRASLSEFVDYQSLFTYIAIGWLTRSFLFNNIDRDMADMIASGDVIARCIRPISLHAQMIGNAIGECFFRLVCFSPILGFVLFALFGVSPPKDGFAFWIFVPSVACAAVVFAEVNYLVGLIAFKTEAVQGVIRAKIFLIEILSGLLVPFSYLPEWLQRVASLTPFPTLTSTPTRIYVGQLRGLEAIEAVAVSALWCLVLVAVSRFLTKRLSHQLATA